MAEAIGIAAACLAFVEAAKFTITTIDRFRKRSDTALEHINTVRDEVRNLSNVLGLIQRKVSLDKNGTVREPFDPRITPMVKKCHETITQVQDLVSEYDRLGKKTGVALWATRGHSQAKELLQTLSDDKAGLQFALQALDVALSRDALTNGDEILSKTTAVLDKTDITHRAVLDMQQKFEDLLKEHKRLRTSPFQGDYEQRRECIDSLADLAASFVDSYDLTSPESSIMNFSTIGLCPSRSLSPLQRSRSFGTPLDEILHSPQVPAATTSSTPSPSRTKSARRAASSESARIPLSEGFTTWSTTQSWMKPDRELIRESERARRNLSLKKRAALDEQLRQISGTTKPGHLMVLLKGGASADATTTPSSDRSPASPLYRAIFHRNYPCAKVLLAYGADPDAVVGDRSYMQLAVRNGDTEAAKLLFRAGTRQKLLEAMNDAVSKESTTMVKLLLENNVTPDQSSLKLAVSRSHVELTRMLLDRGAVPDILCLKKAISLSVPKILRLLLDSATSFARKASSIPNRIFLKVTTHIPELLRKVSKQLSKAASLKDVDSTSSMFKMLLKHGSRDEIRRLGTRLSLLNHAISMPFKTPGTSMQDPLHKAHQDMCRNILHAGIEANAGGSCDVEEVAHTPVSCAIRHQVPLLPDASCVTETVHLLLDNGASVNQPSPQGRPLLLAARKGHEQVASLLLTSGAEYNPLADNESLRVLEESVYRDWTSVTSTLLRRSPSLPLAFVDNNSQAFLTATIKSKNEPLVTQLLEAGFKPQTGVMKLAIDNNLGSVIPNLLASITSDGLEYRRFLDQGHNMVYKAIMHRNGEVATAILQSPIQCGTNTLTMAVRYGMTNTVRSLLSNGVYIRRDDGPHALRTCIHRCIDIAAENCSYHMLDVLWNFLSEHRFPLPLQILRKAVRGTNAELVAFLLTGKFPFDLQLLEETSNVEMMICVWKKAAETSSLYGDTRYLFPREPSTPSFLRKAVRTGNIEIIDSMFTAAQRRHKRGLWGFITLQLAFTDPRVSEATQQYLLQHASNRAGALVFAAERQLRDSIEKFLDDGADPNWGIRDFAPWHCPTDNPVCGFPLIYHAIMQCDTHWVKDLISVDKVRVNDVYCRQPVVSFADVRVESHYWTPLHMAVVLFTSSHRRGPRLETRLEFIARQDRLRKIIRDLVNGGADPKIMVGMWIRSERNARPRHVSPEDLVRKLYPRKLFPTWGGSTRSRLLAALAE
ncbi:uncharacterized protein JN550_002567 [Neoarthrinium moseri]|uniref:uncharacterized protein n=1 Tax=Neoarthrinium moseri TaxID=1658444 RepID=UPI001FDC9462|nr:uncharacterized protein JN550_002567 [Neoarthrinium moseri]KAI1873988.1 hypothetical protein JN550_002567 [Neoarthrinium moseri]